MEWIMDKDFNGHENQASFPKWFLGVGLSCSVYHFKPCKTDWRYNFSWGLTNNWKGINCNTLLPWFIIQGWTSIVKADLFSDMSSILQETWDCLPFFLPIKRSYPLFSCQEVNFLSIITPFKYSSLSWWFSLSHAIMSLFLQKGW